MNGIYSGVTYIFRKNSRPINRAQHGTEEQDSHTNNIQNMIPLLFLSLGF